MNMYTYAPGIAEGGRQLDVGEHAHIAVVRGEVQAVPLGQRVDHPRALEPQQLLQRLPLYTADI